MGEVFEATSLVTGQRVAVKVVNRGALDTLLMERLRREAEAARRIQSEFVPQLYDVDGTPDGELFLVMELLHGETLAARMRRRGGILLWDEVAHLGEDMLRGLIDAHAAGVIHRDLKPGNIFIESLPGHRERARILDFGVCKLDAHDGESLTTTGEAVGTIAYMAPEQIRGASRVDERADLYAFAMLIYEALSGRLAYEASGSIALIACKLERTARGLRDFAQVPIPVGLEALMARCLGRRQTDRPASASELLREWRSLGEATVAPTGMPPPATAADSPATETGLTAAPTLASRRGSRVGLGVAAAALLASVVVLIVGLRLHAGAAAATGQSGGPPVVAVAPTTADLQLPPVVMSAPPAAGNTGAPAPTADNTGFTPPAIDPSTLPIAAPDTDAGAVSPAAVRRRRWGTPRRLPGAATVTHGPSTEPQIVSEPRY
jgi:tRNA A-37 threonylcarbamoyl transferase component Bud32